MLATRMSRLHSRAKYHRESLLDRAITASLRTLRLDDEVLEWVKTALLSSHADEQEHHRAAMIRQLGLHET